jgi:hypothetical protein
LVSALNWVVVRNVVFLELDRPAVLFDAGSIITFFADRWGALSANVDVFAVVLLQVGGLVLLA